MEIFGKEQSERDTCWHSKLKSLGAEPKAKTELGDDEELDKLTESLKQTLYQHHKVAYSGNDKEEFLNRRKPSSIIVMEGILRSNHAV